MIEQTELKTPGDDNSQSDSGASSIEKRRRLLKAGIGIAPVLMSLSSRSVYACQTTRPSGFCSMKVNTSSPGGTKSQCSGKTPSTWCYQVSTHPKLNHGWPDGCYPKTYKGTSAVATKCRDLFGSIDQTCLNVMAGTASGTDEFHQWCVAARLNAKAGLTGSVCTERDVQAMWSECNTKGYYEPTAGQKWYKADCVTYLKSTCA